MANERETVSEVCAEMRQDYYKMGRSNARLDTELMDCLKGFADRLISAHQCEMAAKDAEIAKHERCYQSLQSHCARLEAEYLRATNAPVLECRYASCDVYQGRRCADAVREAKRIYDKGANND